MLDRRASILFNRSSRACSLMASTPPRVVRDDGTRPLRDGPGKSEWRSKGCDNCPARPAAAIRASRFGKTTARVDDAADRARTRGIGLRNPGVLDGPAIGERSSSPATAGRWRSWCPSGGSGRGASPARCGAGSGSHRARRERDPGHRRPAARFVRRRDPSGRLSPGAHPHRSEQLTGHHARRLPGSEQWWPPSGRVWHARPVPALRLRLVARRHVDLQRLSSALCRPVA